MPLRSFDSFQLIEQKTTAVNQMEAELHTKERLCDVYKSSADAANDEIRDLKEQFEETRQLLKESEEG